MDSRIVPTDRLGSALLAAIQAPQGDAQVKALLAFVGESLDLVLLTKEGGTTRLQMPSGQIIEAKGDLPYPLGTRLTVQVLPPDAGQTAPRLKLVEAVPPAPLPILAPLQQGEALQLLARLTVPETPPELAALARLFAALGAGVGEAVIETSGSGRTDLRKDLPTGSDRTPVEAAKPAPPPAAPPSTQQILATLKELPPAALRELQRILFPRAGKPPSLEEMAETFRRVLQTLEADGPAPGSSRSEVRVPQSGRGEPLLDSRVLSAALPKAPVAPARSPADPTAAAQEVLKQLQQSMLGTVTAVPSGNAEPALEPLKNFLLLLLKPSRQEDPPGPEPRVKLDPPAAEAALEPDPLPKPAPLPSPAPPMAEAAPSAAAAVQGAPRTEAPTRESILKMLEALPPAVLQDLHRILFPAARTPPSLPETAEALRALLETAAAGQPAGQAAQTQLRTLQDVLAPFAATADPALELLKNLLRLGSKTASAPAADEAPPRPPALAPAAPGPQNPAPPAAPAVPLAAAPAPQTAQAEPPAREPIVAMLKELPPAVLRDLQRILLPAAGKPPSLPETAAALRALLETAHAGQPAGEAAKMQLKTLQDVLAPLATTAGLLPESADAAVELLDDLLRLGSKAASAQAVNEASPAAPAVPLAGTPAPRAAEAEPPARELIAALLKELPPAVLQDLRRILFPAATEPVSLPEMAEALRILLEAAEPAQPAPEKAGARLAAVTTPSTPGPAPGTAEPAYAPPLAAPQAPTVAPDPSAPTGKTAPPPAEPPLAAAGAAGPPLATLTEAALKFLERIQEAMPLPRLTSTVAPGTANPVLEPLQNLLQFLLQPRGEPAGQALAELLARAGAKAFGAESTLMDLAAAGLSVAVPSETDGPGALPLPAAARASVVPASVELPAEPPGPPTRLLGEVIPRGAESPATQAALPSTGRIVAMLRDLPPALLQDFQRILFPGAPKPPSLPELAEALRGILQALGEAPLPKGGNPQLEATPVRSAPPALSPAPIALQPPAAEGPLPLTPAVGSRLVSAKESLLPAGQGKTGGAAQTAAQTLSSAAAGGSSGGPAAASEEILRRVQQAMSVPAQPLPPMFFQGGGDPALEPLKNLLLFLLRPAFTAEAGSQALADLLAKAATQPPPETPAATRPGADSKQPPTPEPGPVLESGPKTHAAAVRHGEVPKGMPAASSSSPQAAERAPAPLRGQDPATAPRPAAAESQALAAKSWESWLSEGVKTLSDPQSSPREAPFHLAQAREGTAFFELPLPWEGQGKVLQMWVESDPEGESRRNGDKTRRVLVGLHFSALGETRVGIVQAADRLQIRVWAEHPEALKTREEAIRASLADLGPDLDFQVLPLGEPGEVFPSLRSLAAGTGFDALG